MKRSLGKWQLYIERKYIISTPSKKRWYTLIWQGTFILNEGKFILIKWLSKSLWKTNSLMQNTGISKWKLLPHLSPSDNVRRQLPDPEEESYLEKMALKEKDIQLQVSFDWGKQEYKYTNRIFLPSISPWGSQLAKQIRRKRARGIWCLYRILLKQKERWRKAERESREAHKQSRMEDLALKIQGLQQNVKLCIRTEKSKKHKHQIYKK